MLAFAVLMVLAGDRATPAISASAASAPPRVVVVTLDGEVAPITAEYVVRGIRYANRSSAAAVILELSTPGGLGTSMRAIIQAILASRVPVFGYAYPSGARAASAGFYILMSCDAAAMAPGTNTGAAHPVMLGGAQPGKIEAQKIQNDAAAYIRTLAGGRGHNVPLALAAVLQSKSYTDQEALKGGLINFIAASPQQLLAELSGKPIRRINGHVETLQLAHAELVPYRMSLRERVLDMDPDLAFALLVVGALLVYVEFTHPGVIVPGVAGIIMIAVGLFALSLLPLNWAAAGLLILAFILFVLEARFPSHGVLAIGGVVCMVIGAVFLVDTSVPALRVHWSVALGAAVPIAGITIFLMRLVLRAQARKVTTGAQGMVGAIAIVRTALAPEGTVRIHGEIWRARSEAPATPGAQVCVRAVRGLLLEVEPVAQVIPPASLPASPGRQP
ncbi:MAG: NfeD family protein [Terriglobales bacterium]